MEILKNKAIGQVISGDKHIIFNAGLEASIEYTHPKRHIVPKIQILFSLFGLPFVPIEIVGTDINKVITGFSWTKDRNNPGGILQVTIAPDKKIIQEIVNLLNKYSFNLYSKIWKELGVDLEDLFKPMTLCQVWINGYHLMTGTVRSCMRMSTVANESREISYNLVVEELGNIYNQGTTSLDLILLDGMQRQIADSMQKSLSLSANLIGTTIQTGIQAILNAFKVSTLTEFMKGSDGFPLAMRLVAWPNPVGGIANLGLASFMTLSSDMFEMNSAGSSQSLWSFIQSFIPNPWMELFTESGGRTIVTDAWAPPSALLPGLNYVVARTTPYTNPMLGLVNPVHLAQTLVFDLTAIHMLIGGDFIIITDDIIENKALGFDSSNQATVFRTVYSSKCAGGGIADVTDRGIKSVGPMNPFASGGIPTFGRREMIQSVDCTSQIGLGIATSYMERIQKNIMGIPGQILSKNELSNLLATWFRNQSRFREGTVTVKNIPYARPGMYCLYLPALSGKKVENLRDIGIYYIDSLAHNYSLENESLSFTTTLNLIRGVPLPLSVAQTALLLFDFEILPPESGMADGEYAIMKATREALSKL
jgi:hypothetical protein